MKIIVLMGSPNRNGSTGILVENCKRGAEEAVVRRIKRCVIRQIIHYEFAA